MLVKQLIEGKPLAFKQLVDTYQNIVYNTCLSFVHQVQDAEDLAQETFLEVYQSIKTFRKDSQLSTWIYRIAVNKCLDFIRKQKRKKRSGFLHSLSGLSPGLEAGFLAHKNHPGVGLENKERAQILFNAIDQLPDAQKTAFTLHKLEGLPYEEIAKIMKKSLSSVESLMHRARKNLQKLLGNYYKQLNT